MTNFVNVKLLVFLKMFALFVGLFFFLLFPVTGNTEEKNGNKTFFREDFQNLDSWKPLEFRSIKRHSKYTVVQEGSKTFLKTESNNSASGIVQKETFNVNDSSVLSWRWKTNNIYQKADGMQKKGDDYPLRLYVLFQHDNSKDFFFEKMGTLLLKSFYGKSLPDSAISYVWSSKERKKGFYPTLGVQDAYIFPLNSGTKNVGNWQEHSVNIVDDYRRAFGKEPPTTACIAIMNDSDNTGESSISFIDYIEGSSTQSFELIP